MIKTNRPVNLIGAASDLLEVCEELVEEADDIWSDDCHGHRYCCLCSAEVDEEHDADCLILKAQAAVAKARAMPNGERVCNGCGEAVEGACWSMAYEKGIGEYGVLLLCSRCMPELKAGNLGEEGYVWF